MLGGRYSFISHLQSYLLSQLIHVGFYAWRILRLSKLQTYLSFALGGGLSGWYINYVGKEPQVAKAERIKTIRLHQMRMERENFQKSTEGDTL